MQDEQIISEKVEVGEYSMEQNLIFAQSDYLRIFTYDGTTGEEKLVLRSEFNLHDKVIDILRVPTSQFTNQKAFELAPKLAGSKLKKQSRQISEGRDDDPDSVAYPQYLDNDLLFVLTQGLHCLLLGFNKKTQKAELISKGYLKEQNQV